MKHTAMTMLAIAALGLAGCETSDPNGEGANVVTPDAEEATDTPADNGTEEPTAEPTEAAEGTRQNPLPLGTTATIGDWEITVTNVNPDAADEVAAENQFNDPPAEGEQFVMIAMEGTYTGEDSGTIMGNFIYRVVGAGGNSFDDRCGVIPDDITDTGETFTGGSVSGNMCFRVASDQVDGGVFMMEGFTFSDTQRTFWSLQ